jgi:hypothetical protein
MKNFINYYIFLFIILNFITKYIVYACDSGCNCNSIGWCKSCKSGYLKSFDVF